MKLLVTGGAGFIGSCFVRHVLKKHPDYKIINLDALTYCGNLENLDDLKENPNHTFVSFQYDTETQELKLVEEYEGKVYELSLAGGSSSGEGG